MPTTQRTLELVTVDDKPGKLRELLPLLTDDPERVHVLKRDTLILREGEPVSLSDGWTVLAAGTADVAAPAK